MKKLWKKVVFLFWRAFLSFLIWGVHKAFNSKMRVGIEPTIIHCYREIRKRDLPLDTRLVASKKGKLKTKILFFETAEGTLRCQIGRHNKNATIAFEENPSIVGAYTV